MIKKIALCISILASTAVLAEDARQLATLPAAAAETLRSEMRANMLTLNEIISLTVTGKTTEAGLLAEEALGNTAMGKNRKYGLQPSHPKVMGFESCRRCRTRGDLGGGLAGRAP